MQSISETQQGMCSKLLYSRAGKHTFISYLAVFPTLPYALDFYIYRGQ